MKNYVRDEYNRQIRNLMAQGCMICADSDVARGSYTGEEMRLVLEHEDGNYYGVIIASKYFYGEEREARGVSALVDEVVEVKTVKWAGKKEYSVLWLNEAEELECVEFYRGSQNEEAMPKDEANARAEKQFDRWVARNVFDKEPVVSEEAVEIVLRHARKQYGTKHAKADQVLKIWRTTLATGKTAYSYDIRRNNGMVETRKIG